MACQGLEQTPGAFLSNEGEVTDGIRSGDSRQVRKTVMEHPADYVGISVLHSFEKYLNGIQKYAVRKTASFLFHVLGRPKKFRRQQRRQSKGDYHGGQKREDNGPHEFPEHEFHDSAAEKKGRKGDTQHEGGRHDGEPHFGYAGNGRFFRGFPHAQVAFHRMDVNDGIVHQSSYGNEQAYQSAAVKAHAHGNEEKDGHGKRGGNGDK